MRAVLVFILLFTVASSCLAELTQQDLEKIGNLMDRKLEPVKLDIAEMKGKMEALEGKMATKDDLINMRKDFSKEIKAVKKDVAEVKRDVTEMKGNMATRGDINTVRDQIFSLYRWIIAMWVTIFLAVFGIPYLYGRADREKVKKLATDVRELSKLKAEVETLKAIKETEERRKETAKEIAEKNPEFAEAYRLIGLL